jgi:hypothetical protein
MACLARAIPSLPVSFVFPQFIRPDESRYAPFLILELRRGRHSCNAFPRGRRAA